MTAHKHLKQRIRARMEKTGEQLTYDGLHREPRVAAVGVDGAVGSPCGQVGDDPACV